MGYKWFHILADGWVRLFDTEKCDGCGDTILAANAIKIERRSLPVAIASGVREWQGRIPRAERFLPEEGGWNDSIDGVACPSCDQQHPND